MAGARPVEQPEVGAAGPTVAVVETLGPVGPVGPRGVVPGVFVGAVAPMGAVAESLLVAAEPTEPVGAASVLEADPSRDASAAACLPMGAELELVKMVAPEPGPMEAEPVFGIVLALEPDPTGAELEVDSRYLSGAEVVVGPGPAGGSPMGAVLVTDWEEVPVAGVEPVAKS